MITTAVSMAILPELLDQKRKRVRFRLSGLVFITLTSSPYPTLADLVKWKYINLYNQYRIFCIDDYCYVVVILKNYYDIDGWR